MAMLALALHSGQEPLQVRTIAQKQRLPIRFLEQVMSALKKDGLVESVRGRQGGYRLTKSPEEISLGEVLRAAEGPLVEIEPAGHREVGKSSGLESRAIEGAVLEKIWAEVNTLLEKQLNAINFRDLCDRKKDLEGKQVLMFHI